MIKDLFHKKRHYATLVTPESAKATKPEEAVVKDVPVGLVNKCKQCSAILMTRELTKNQFTCPHCGYHFQIDALTRIEYTLDTDCFFEYDTDLTSTNPLDFPDYPSKLAKAKQGTGLTEAVLTGEGTIHGNPVVIGVMDPRYILGSMGSAVGEKLTRAMERALQKRYPMILFTASGGARMQEGVLSLMQMAKTSMALRKMADQGVLYISVITHPTTGGVSASFASLGDVILAEPGAMFGFAGPRVIEQTMRQKLPDDFQTAEFNLKHGMIDGVVNRKELRDTLGTILHIHALGGWRRGE